MSSDHSLQHSVKLAVIALFTAAKFLWTCMAGMIMKGGSIRLSTFDAYSSWTFRSYLCTGCHISPSLTLVHVDNTWGVKVVVDPQLTTLYDTTIMCLLRTRSFRLTAEKQRNQQFYTCGTNQWLRFLLTNRRHCAVVPVPEELVTEDSLPSLRAMVSSTSKFSPFFAPLPNWSLLPAFPDLCFCFGVFRSAARLVLLSVNLMTCNLCFTSYFYTTIKLPDSYLSRKCSYIF